MLTQEPTDVQQIAKEPRWPRAAVAFAATIVIVAAAVGIWAFANDNGPVAAGDAQIEVTFTGDEVLYTGDRQIVGGSSGATFVFVNESTATPYFTVQRFETGSPELAEELAWLPEGGDILTTGRPRGNVQFMNPVSPKGLAATGREVVSIPLVPGTYIVDAGVPDVANNTHVWRGAVIEVIAAE